MVKPSNRANEQVRTAAEASGPSQVRARAVGTTTMTVSASTTPTIPPS